MQKTSSFLKKTTILMALTAACLSPNANAANWLMLQGTEKPNQAPRAKLWGFAQVDYQQTANTPHPNGSDAAFNQMPPQLTTSSGFNIKRARIGVRGGNFPLDPNVNYFLMAELGNNGITTGENGSQGQLTDASVTLNHLDGARIRIGLFKTPGSEESFKGIPVFNYVNFTTGTDRLLIERKLDGTFNPTNETGTGVRTDAVSAARDTGIQVFDTFKQGEWEHSYAIMLGNGNGLALTDNDENRDLYLYASTEKAFANSTGPRRKSMKFYAWSQSGKRTYDDAEFDRERKGLGMTYFDGKYRVAAEYFTADGMIFGGPKGGVAGNPLTVFTDQKATAYQIDLGYRIKPNIELNARYDVTDSATAKDDQSGTNADKHRIFKTTTLGAQYFLNKKTSIRLNYEIRDIEAPDAPSAAPVHEVLDSLDNRLSAQITMVF